MLIRRLAFRPVTLSVNVFCFFRGKAFSQMLGNMSVTKMVVPDTDYTDGSSNGGGDNSNPSGGNDGDQGENPLG